MKQTFITILLGLCLLLTPNFAIAAEVSFSPKEHLSTQKRAFTTTIVLNSESESINAVEGILKVDPKLASGIQLSDSGSVITYWIVEPVFNAEQGTIRFSGAVPGGYTGGSGILFSVIFPPYDGETIDRAVSISDFKAYKNDGLGTSASVVTSNFSLGDIAGQIDQGITDQLYLDGSREDNIPPEVFSPQISRNENVFGGRWFINFSTVDKQSGIDRYEIQESRTGSLDSGKWVVATSPYELVDQELHSFVYVIAIDRQGNERIIKVFPRNPLSLTELYGKQIGAIILLMLAAGLIYYRRTKNKKSQNKNGKSHFSTK